MKYELAQTSLLGNRKSNQDRCLVLEAPDAILLALADGMGGHPRGESAAQILMDTSRKAFLTSRKPIANPRVFLSGLLELAHRQILEFGQQQTPPIEPRTTGVLCLIQGNKAHWAHLGDSRLYVMRAGVICFRTDDHSYVEHLRQQGLISSAQVHTHRFRNFVTRCLGGQNNHPVAELGEPFSLQEEDIILLCSDGFWAPLPERALVNALSDKAQAFTTRLENLAQQAESTSKPESDNVTGVALRWLKGTFDLDPADINMALTHNADPHEQKNISEEHIQEAIDDLRRLLDKLDIEE
jgi:serine/threonine protein phosphatase PrpC